MIHDCGYQLAVYHRHPTGELYDLENAPTNAKEVSEHVRF